MTARKDGLPIRRPAMREWSRSVSRGISKSCYCGDTSRQHHLGVCNPCYRKHQYWTAPGKRDTSRAQCRDYYYTNHARERARADAYKLKNKDKLYMRRVKKEYGLSARDYYALLDVQGGRCAICQTPVDKLPQRPAVDHCHSSGEVRGILCKPCNQGLGYHEKYATGAWSHYLAFPPMAKLRYIHETPADQQIHPY